MYWEERVLSANVFLCPHAKRVQVSLFEVYKLIPQLLLSFDFELDEPEKEWDIWTYGFFKPQGLRVRVKEKSPQDVDGARRD